MFLGLSSLILSFSDHDWINSVSVENHWWIAWAEAVNCTNAGLQAWCPICGGFPLNWATHMVSLWIIKIKKLAQIYFKNLQNVLVFTPHPTPRYGDLGFKSIVWTLQLEEENQSEEADLEVSPQPINLLRNMQYMWSDLVWQFSPNKCNPDI